MSDFEGDECFGVVVLTEERDGPPYLIEGQTKLSGFFAVLDVASHDLAFRRCWSVLITKDYATDSDVSSPQRVKNFRSPGTGAP